MYKFLLASTNIFKAHRRLTNALKDKALAFGTHKILIKNTLFTIFLHELSPTKYLDVTSLQ